MEDGNSRRGKWVNNCPGLSHRGAKKMKRDTELETSVPV